MNSKRLKRNIMYSPRCKFLFMKFAVDRRYKLVVGDVLIYCKGGVC